MKKTKQQKGITLIALIITIVVLLILAVVAISAIQNDGILSYAQNAAKDYNQASANESEILGGYLNYLDKNNGGSGSGTGTGSGAIGDATVGTKVTSLSTINGQEYSSTNPVIPAGFMAVNTTTSSWDAADLAAEVKKGLVISDGTSEFVWIPVATLSEFAKVTSDVDANGRTNYQGVLYDFAKADDGTLTSTEMSNYGQGTTSYREPEFFEASSYYDYDEEYLDSTTIFQESFNAMVESVAEYKGFYVGRYETSLNGSIAQSAAGATSMYYTTWYDMYDNSQTYATLNEGLGVVSEMIWGCQYDAMMRWMQENNIDVTSTTPTDTSRGVAASSNTDTNRITGSSSNDLLNNVYDLLGNSYEWTQEASGNNIRIGRASSYNINGAPHLRSCYHEPTSLGQGGKIGSRLTLYVEV